MRSSLSVTVLILFAWPRQGLSEIQIGRVFQDRERVIVELIFPSIEIHTINKNSGNFHYLNLIELKPDGQTELLTSEFINRLLFVPEGRRPNVKIISRDERRIQLSSAPQLRYINEVDCKEYFVPLEDRLPKLERVVLLSDAQVIGVKQTKILTFLPIAFDKKSHELIIRRKIVAEITWTKNALGGTKNSISESFQSIPDTFFINTRPAEFKFQAPKSVRQDEFKQNINIRLGIDHSLVKNCAERTQNSAEILRYNEIKLLDSQADSSSSCEDCDLLIGPEYNERDRLKIMGGKFRGAFIMFLKDDVNSRQHQRHRISFKIFGGEKTEQSPIISTRDPSLIASVLRFLDDEMKPHRDFRAVFDDLALDSALRDFNPINSAGGISPVQFWHRN